MERNKRKKVLKGWIERVVEGVREREVKKYGTGKTRGNTDESLRMIVISKKIR